jgi:MFS family permease
VAGPVSGLISDRIGVRGLATSGMLVFAGSFVGLLSLPVQFPYWVFALFITLNGIGGGMYAAPNSSSIMGSVPASQRGVASGMRATFQNSGTAVSIGVFFSLMVMGLSATLPGALTSGLQAHGVAPGTAGRIGALPPVSSLFAAVLGVNPVQHLLADNGALGSLSAANRQVLTGREFFPDLLSGPFHHGLVVVFGVAAALGLLAAFASLLRGKSGAATTVCEDQPMSDARAASARRAQ